jgi:hypothetical protein
MPHLSHNRERITENLCIYHIDNRTTMLTYSKKHPFAKSAQILPSLAATHPQKTAVHVYI